MDDSSRSHSSPESMQASGSRIIPGPLNSNCCRLLSATLFTRTFKRMQKCCCTVRHDGHVHVQREGGVSGTNPVWHRADVGSPLHGRSVKATPWDHLRCNHITSLDHSVQPNTRSAPPSGLGFTRKAGYGCGRPASVPGQVCLVTGSCLMSKSLLKPHLLCAEFDLKAQPDTLTH